MAAIQRTLSSVAMRVLAICSPSRGPTSQIFTCCHETEFALSRCGDLAAGMLPVSDSVMTSVFPSGVSAQLVVMRPCCRLRRDTAARRAGRRPRRSRGRDCDIQPVVPRPSPARPGRRAQAAHGRSTAPCPRPRRGASAKRQTSQDRVIATYRWVCAVFSTSPFGLGPVAISRSSRPSVMQPPDPAGGILQPGLTLVGEQDRLVVVQGQVVEALEALAHDRLDHRGVRRRSPGSMRTSPCR